jgi:hypothetical protein
MFDTPAVRSTGFAWIGIFMIISLNEATPGTKADNAPRRTQMKSYSRNITFSFKKAGRTGLPFK